MTNKDKTVLIVEDEIITAIETELELTERGFNVVGITSCSEDTLIIIKSNRPDIVLMDIHLQGRKDGIQLSKEIFKYYQPMIIFVSAYNDFETRKRLKKISSRYFLSKPYSYDELIEVINGSLTDNEEK